MRKHKRKYGVFCEGQLLVGRVYELRDLVETIRFPTIANNSILSGAMLGSLDWSKAFNTLDLYKAYLEHNEGRVRLVRATPERLEWRLHHEKI